MVLKRGPGKRGKRRAGTGQAAQSERAAPAYSSRTHASSTSQDALDHEPHTPRKERASFTSLPGEIRNSIYHLALIADGPIKIRYTMAGKGNRFLVTNSVPATKEGRPPDSSRTLYASSSSNTPANKSKTKAAVQTKLVPSYNACKALHNFSLISREIRKEVRPFFYSKNVFEYLVDDNSECYFVFDYTNAMYPKCCIRFLEHMGADGRAALGSLKLCDARNWPYQGPDCHTTKHVADLFRLLRQCTSLAVLDMNNILAVAPLSIKRWSDPLRISAAPLSGPPAAAIQSLATRFSMIPGLKRLRISYIHCFGHRKRYAYSQMVRFIGSELANVLDCKIVVEAFALPPSFFNFRVLHLSLCSRQGRPSIFTYGKSTSQAAN